VRGDLVQGAVWALGGGVIVYASWTMDRLERHGAALHTAPGLVPGLLGLVLLALGVVLAVRASRRGIQAERSVAFAWGNTPLVLVLCLSYAIGLVGRAPFWLATFLFVTAFIAIFEYPVRRRMALAPVYGAATSIVVTVLFESVFLVRLP
jgi:putative tricarboxylic transport membrane protein